LKRDPKWTGYACHSAAAFTRALILKGGILPPQLGSPPYGGRDAQNRRRSTLPKLTEPPNRLDVVRLPASPDADGPQHFVGRKDMSGVMASSVQDHFRYDVFISYRQEDPDRTWTRRTLLPRLEAAGLRACIDNRDFRLGSPLVLEMARAVEQSRYTLAVLSPAYLRSNFTELENVLAEHLGLEISQHRLIAVMREPCKPRLGMRARLWLDMTDDGELNTNVERLVYELRQAPAKD
jgi:hypothetical protein